MPANKTRLTLVRQWGMLRLLPSWPNKATYAEIAARLESEEDFKVDPNTVRRDLEQLALIFPIYVEECGRTHYVSWAKGADTALRTMGVGEAMALVMAEQHLGQLLPTSVFESLQAVFNRAHLTLKNIDGHNPASTWMDKVRAVPPTQPMVPPDIKPDIQETLARALLENRQVEVMYGGSGKNVPRQMRLHPLGMILRTPSVYLVATAWDYRAIEDVRLYALHRFTEARILDEAVQVPEGFDLDRELERGLADFGSAREPIQLEMIVTKELAAILEETPLATRGLPPISDQLITKYDKENYKVKVTVNDSWQLRWWLRSRQSQIKHSTPDINSSTETI